MANTTLDNFSKRLVDLGESGRSLINDPELQKKIRKARKDAESIIRKHPLTSIGVGLIAGFFIGRIFRR